MVERDPIPWLRTHSPWRVARWMRLSRTDRLICTLLNVWQLASLGSANNMQILDKQDIVLARSPALISLNESCERLLLLLEWPHVRLLSKRLPCLLEEVIYLFTSQVHATFNQLQVLRFTNLPASPYPLQPLLQSSTAPLLPHGARCTLNIFLLSSWSLLQP